ncbi:MAG: CDP-diglyceride synthetase [Parcubacteria group bacterium GW2011_GWA1_38_7]|nr:MAG: CDP-diglyceride synthetase [Parcubacteria group bacterium GW2011_GWA1_38_7]
MIFQIVSLTLPVLLPGLVLIFALKKNYLKFLDFPLDHHLKINGSRLFGDNKTYRGLLVFLISSTIASLVLQGLYLNGYRGFIHPVFKSSPILIGILYAVAYAIGELVNSAAKRQMKIAPGAITRSSLKSLQKFMDLSDGIIVVAVMLTFFTLVTASQALLAAVIGIGLHLGTDKLMQNLDLKKDF